MANYTNTRVRNPRQDLIGQRFTKLVVRQWMGNSRWLCDCDCGKTSLVLTANLKRNNSKSCGCLSRTVATIRNTRHGLHNTHAYRTWCSIKRRCFEVTNRSYPRYGGAGITMHEDWISDPAAFIAHVGQPPGEDYTLDRIDNKLGYFPDNVRWATPLEQGANKSNNRIVTYQGATYTIAQLARKIAHECGITKKQFQRALEKAMYGKAPFVEGGKEG